MPPSNAFHWFATLIRFRAMEEEEDHSNSPPVPPPRQALPNKKISKQKFLKIEVIDKLYQVKFSQTVD